MTDSVTIAIVDDQSLTREGVSRIVERTPWLKIVGQGATAQDAIDIASRTCADIVILELDIPGGGREALRRIKQDRAEARVMILTAASDEGNVLELLALGADGYILKSISGDDLVYALGMLHRGGRYVMPSLAAQLLTAVGLSRRVGVVSSLEHLTQREREIAARVGEGLSNKVIGKAMDLSEKTVKHYLTIIFKKLQIHNRQALIGWVHGQSVSAESNPVVLQGTVEETDPRASRRQS